MQLVTRDEWGAQPPHHDWRYVDATDGVKIHYEGTEVPADLPDHHERCAGRVRDIQASHMANTSEGWIDIAYNAVVCPHGYVFEGRGLHHETGANGNQSLNLGHYAVCAMVGDDGLTEPTDAMLHGLRDAIEWFRAEGGAGDEIEGHRDGYATSCPGEPLYAWVRAGAPRPGSAAPAGEPAPPAVQPQAGSGNGPDWPGEYLAVRQPMLHDDTVRTWQQRMADRGWTIDVDGWYGDQSAGVCRGFQQDSTANGWPLDADGVVGPKTWRASWDRPVS